MTTIFAGLPFYDSITKQDKNRSHSKIPFYCPTTHLPPFVICDDVANVPASLVYSIVSCDATEIIITAYFAAAPAIVTTATNFYVIYDGTTLGTFLPRGTYYIKAMSECLTTWTNGNFNTFASSGLNITSAINTSGAEEYARTNGISVIVGDKITISLNLTLNSGVNPRMYLYGSGAVRSDIITLNSGVNNIVLTSTYAGVVYICIDVTNNSNFSISDFTSYGKIYYSEHFLSTGMTAGEWMKLEFSNTTDLGDIPYSQGVKQIVYFNTKMNFPLNEYVEVGEEKDGEFIAEKLVTKYLFRISDYVGRALHRVLIRLPQHDTITITDEVGNTYTPAAGNAILSTSDWLNFETCHVVIQFNE